MRSWRIHSYLNTCEDKGEEGLNQPVGPDAFEDPSPTQQPEVSDPHFEVKEPNASSYLRQELIRPRFGKPTASKNTNTDSYTANTKDLPPPVSDLKTFALEKKEWELEKDRDTDLEKGAVREGVGDVEMKDGSDLMRSKHESFRSRINPLLQRSSRLRSSLIFSSSKAEMHTGSHTGGIRPTTEESEEDSGRDTSVVARILEKRRSFSREPLEWRKKADEKDKGKGRESDGKDGKEPPQEEKETRLKDVIEVKEEHQNTKEVKAVPAAESTDDVKSSSLNMNDPASRLQYFKDLAAKRKATRMETASQLKELEPVEKKKDVSDKPPQNTLTNPTVSVGSEEPEPAKPDIASKLAELSRRPSTSSSKPPIIAPKPYISSTKPPETTQTQKKDDTSDGLKKDLFKSLRPLPSPKLFRRDQLKLKGLNPRRISCGEEILTTDATDAEKSELKKSRSQSSSTLPRDESKDGLHKNTGSNTSINTLGGEGKGEGKPLDFLKKQTQRLKGFLGPKDKDKKSSGDDRGMSTVKEKAEDSSKKQTSTVKDNISADQTTTNHKTTTGLSGASRYQAPGSSVLFSSNLRDDTKVILEQISANSQKNRLEREEDKDSETKETGLERQNSIKRSRLLRPPGNIQEREGLLKRIESMRKEKKVYSRFEVVYNCKDDVCSVDGKVI